MRDASGAVVCGIREAWGSHGAGASGEGLDAVIPLSETLSVCLGGFSVRLRAFTRLSDECFSGLLERSVTVSRVRTSFRSVRRSPAEGTSARFLDCDCALVALARTFSLSPPMEADG
jgi:hypothetical protein